MTTTIKNNELPFKLTELGLLDVSAIWCGPCRIIAPIIEEISDEIQDITVATCDIDDNPQIAIDYGIRSVPTFIFFKNGVEVDRMVGAVSKKKLVDKIDENLLKHEEVMA